METVTESRITCPQCGARKTEIMPGDSCTISYRCETCDALLTPSGGDCCVFCSYGSVPCPPIQRERLDARAARDARTAQQ